MPVCKKRTRKKNHPTAIAIAIATAIAAEGLFIWDDHVAKMKHKIAARLMVTSVIILINYQLSKHLI